MLRQGQQARQQHCRFPRRLNRLWRLCDCSGCHALTCYLSKRVLSYSQRSQRLLRLHGSQAGHALTCAALPCLAVPSAQPPPAGSLAIDIANGRGEGSSSSSRGQHIKQQLSRSNSLPRRRAPSDADELRHPLLGDLGSCCWGCCWGCTCRYRRRGAVALLVCLWCLARD